MIHYHTGKAWQVLPDPELRGKHPLHDNRWITTAGAHWEENPAGYQGADSRSWSLEDGSAICTLRDTQAQAFDAALIAAAPALLASLASMVEMMDKGEEPGRGSDWYIAAKAALEQAEPPAPHRPPALAATQSRPF